MLGRAHDRYWEVKYATFTAASVSLCRIVPLIVYWTDRAREAVAFTVRLCDHDEDESGSIMLIHCHGDVAIER